MKVLLRDARSNDLCYMDVTLAGYEKGELWLHGHGEDAAVIQDLEPMEANAIIHSLYERGQLDLREHPAYINEHLAD